jgi:hypothetical protein
MRNEKNKNVIGASIYIVLTYKPKLTSLKTRLIFYTRLTTRVFKFTFGIEILVLWTRSEDLDYDFHST